MLTGDSLQGAERYMLSVSPAKHLLVSVLNLLLLSRSVFIIATHGRAEGGAQHYNQVNEDGASMFNERISSVLLKEQQSFIKKITSRTR